MNDTVALTRELARIAKDNELSELEYSQGETRIKLILESSEPAPMQQVVLTPSAEIPAPIAAAPVAPPAAVTPAAPAAESGEKIHSPLPGVFYRASRPGAPPFVEVGQQVSPGQTLCIVEAMKLMNELTAEQPCVIKKILVENAEAVEEGQALFLIDPL